MPGALSAIQGMTTLNCIPVGILESRQADYEALFNRTAHHPVVGHLAEWVPARWLLTLSNPAATDTTDLGDWGSNAPLVDLSALYADILKNGMRDPVIVGVGRVTRRVRLEAGNHRVRAMLQQGILWLPAVAYVGDSAITHDGNGVHEGLRMDLKLPPATSIMGPYPVKEYRKLSEVLFEMPSH